jgi:hypothetical protein
MSIRVNILVGSRSSPDKATGDHNVHDVFAFEHTIVDYVV